MRRRIRSALFISLLPLLFLLPALRPDPSTSAKAEAEGLQPQTGVTLETQINSGLFRAILTLTGRGQIFFNVPFELVPGEVISGTIITEPSGQNNAERKRNQEELDGYTIEIAGKKLPVSQKSFQLTVPTPQGGQTTTLSITDAKGREVGRADIAISPEAPPVMEFVLPTFGQAGDLIELAGPFDGILSPSDSLTAGKDELQVLGESRRGATALNRNLTPGVTTLKLNEGGRTVKGDFRNVAIDMSAKLHLMTNEVTVLNIRASGLGGLEGYLPLNVKNMSPDVLRMEGGNAQTFLIGPEDVQAGGHYTITETLTGIRPGAYSILANLKRDCNFTIALHNADTTGGFQQVRISAVGSTKITGVSADPWLQTSSLPYSVLLRPGSAPIPPGTHLVTVSVGFNFMGGGQRVLVEWLDVNGRVHCRQYVDVDCGIALKSLPAPGGTRQTAQFAHRAMPGTIQTNQPALTLTPSPTPALCSDASAFVFSENGGLSALKMEGDCDVTFTAAPMFGCNTYQFTNTTDYGAGPPPLFTWHVKKDGYMLPPVISTDLMYEFKDPGTYEVSLSAYGMACGDEVEDSQSYFITIPPLNPDFTWKQKECEPLTLGFTNQTGRAGLSYEWDIWDNKVYKYTVENPTHTFTGFGEHKVCLKVNSPDGCHQTACKTVKVSEDLQPDFDWEYCLRNQQDKPKVTFINKSTGGVCPITYKWEFGDNTPPSTQKDPVHEYAGNGPYTVKLTMTDSAKPPNKETKEHVIDLKVCTGDFTTDICPDGDVIFRTYVSAEYPHWEFPGGDDYFFLFDRKNKERRVRYTDPGRYFVTMTYKDENHCKCTVAKGIVINKVECCERNDKDKILQRDFSYGGDQYRMRGKLVIRNIMGLHYVKVKTVLKKKNKHGIYVRAKAGKIRATWAGKVYTDGKECCCENESLIDANSPVRTNTSKAKHTHWVGKTWLGEKFRARKDSVTSTHYVQVDKGHNPETFTLTVGDECDRCRKRP